MDLGIGGRRAAVAAASKGLGFGVAQALAAEGVKVAICGRQRPTIDAAAAQIGGGTVPIVADVSTVEGATDRVCAVVVPLMASVDGFVNSLWSLDTFTASVPPLHRERSHCTCAPDHASTPGVVWKRPATRVVMRAGGVTR